MTRLRPWMWTLVTILLGVGLYAIAGFVRSEQLADFEVYRTAAARALAAQPLYHPEELPYQQYKYLPAFALAMAPFAWLPKELAEGLWFALSVGLAAWFMRLSLLALPDRRIAGDALVWFGLLVTAKFFQRELGFGQTNLLLGIVLLGAVLAARQGRRLAAGLLVGVGVFIKPYALVLVPWLLWVRDRARSSVCGSNGGRACPSGRGLRMGGKPQSPVGLVPRGHGDDEATADVPREYFVCIDVGQVAEAA